MTDERDRLQFDVVLDLKTAEAEALAFQKRFDKPLVIKVTLDTKPVMAELQALEKEAKRVAATLTITADSSQAVREVGSVRDFIAGESAHLQLKVDDKDLFADIARIQELINNQHASIFVGLQFNEEDALRDIEGFKNFVEHEAGQIDIKGDFDFPHLAEQVRLAIDRINATNPTVKVHTSIVGPPVGAPGTAGNPLIGLPPTGLPSAPPAPAPPRTGTGFGGPLPPGNVSARLTALQKQADFLNQTIFALNRQDPALLEEKLTEVRFTLKELREDVKAGKISVNEFNDAIRDEAAFTDLSAKEFRQAAQAVLALERDIARLERQLDRETAAQRRATSAAAERRNADREAVNASVSSINRSDPRALPSNLAGDRDALARLRIEFDRGRISADQLDHALRRVAAASQLEKRDFDRAAAAAKLLATEQKKLDAAAAKAATGGGGGGKTGVIQGLFFGEGDPNKLTGSVDDAVKNLGRFAGKGQEARALVSPGGLFAAGAAGAALLAFELAKLPIEVAKFSFEIGKAGLDLAKFGINAAIEVEPLIRALEGISTNAPTLKDLFGGEQTNINTIFGAAFLDLGHQVAADLFGPLNDALANFAASVAPHFAPIAAQLAPIIQHLSDTLAGPIGDKFGLLLEKIAGAAAKIVDKLADQRLLDGFDIFASAIDAAIPGIEALIEAFFVLVENSKELVPALVDTGSQILQLVATAVELNSVTFSTIADSLRELNDFLRGLNLVFDEIGKGFPQTQLLVETAINGVTDKLNGLIDAAVRASHVPILGTIFHIPGFDTSQLTAVTATMNSTTAKTDELAEHLKKLGAAASEIKSFEEFNSSLQKLIRFGLVPIPKNVQIARDRILELIHSADEGKLTFDQFQQAELGIIQSSKLTTGEIGLLTKALQEEQKAIDKDTKAQEQFQASLDKINTTLSGEPVFASATVNAIAFAAAVSDGAVSLDEFNAVVAVTGLSAKEAEGIFTKIAKGITEVRTALDKMLPSFDSALKNVDLAKVKFGRSFEAVLSELKKQVGDTAFFFNDIDKAIARGRIDSLRLILTSGATKQEQERFVHELAVGGDAQTAELDRQAKAFGTSTEKFQERIQRFGSILGAPVIEGLTKDIPGALAKINSFADQVQAEALKRFTPGNPDNIKLAETIQTFFSLGTALNAPDQATADKIVGDFKKLQSNLAANLTPEQATAFETQAKNIAAAATTSFSTELKTELPKAIDEVGKSASNALSNVEVHPKITVDIKDALTSIAVVAQLLNLTDKNIAMPKIVIPIEDALLSIAVVAELINLLDHDSATVDVFIDYSEVTEGVDTVTTILGELNGASSTVKVLLDLTAFDRTLTALNAALDALQNRTVTVDIIANVIQTATTRKDGGPVLPGFGYNVNDGGLGREGLLDDRGFQMLPPGGYQTFDRPGIIIPARDVHRFEDRVAAPSHVSTSVASHSESVTHNSPTIVVNGSGRDPMLFAKRVVAMLP